MRPEKYRHLGIPRATVLRKSGRGPLAREPALFFTHRDATRRDGVKTPGACPYNEKRVAAFPPPPPPPPLLPASSASLASSADHYPSASVGRPRGEETIRFVSRDLVSGASARNLT